MNAVFVTQPVGCGAISRPRSSFRPVLAYAATSTVAGAATGLALGTLGLLLTTVLPGWAWGTVLVVLASIGVLGIYLELQGRVHPLPQRSAQVPRRWTLWRSRTRTGAAFGGLIGSGVCTFIDHAAAFTVGALLVASASPMITSSVGVVYGFVRATPLVVAWLRQSQMLTAGEEHVWKGAGRALPLVAGASLIWGGMLILSP